MFTFAIFVLFLALSYSNCHSFKRGCVYNGKFYKPGDSIKKVYRARTSWCWWRYCNDYGHVVFRNKLNCKGKREAITPSTTTTETTTTTIPTTPIGCFHKGKYYKPGEEISRGYDPSSNWCYGSFCDRYSLTVLQWDNFNCVKSTTTSTTVPTMSFTTSSTTTPPKGCYYNGRYYKPGEEISRGYDPSSNWCYGSFCDRYSLTVLQWDNFNCVKSTTTSTTGPTTRA